MKACVLIPAYNEAAEIKEVIRQIRQQGLAVVVVDDGSSDNTAQIAASDGAVVLKNIKNEGKGASLNKGFAYCLENGFDAVIAMDGDGQHLPQDLHLFINAARTPDAGIIVGNRMSQTRNMPLVRFLTNKFMSWLISLICGQRIPDSQCGFRLIKKEVLEKIKLKTSKFEVESELLIAASRAGFKIGSLPVSTVYGAEISHINPITDTLRFIKFILWTWRN